MHGLGDSGAHVGLVCDASTTTYMLTHWVRDRTRGRRLPLERAVRRLTARPAELYGLGDRGAVDAGQRADLNLIDLERLRLVRPEQLHDLPGRCGAAGAAGRGLRRHLRRRGADHRRRRAHPRPPRPPRPRRPVMEVRTPTFDLAGSSPHWGEQRRGLHDLQRRGIIPPPIERFLIRVMRLAKQELHPVADAALGRPGLVQQAGGSALPRPRPVPRDARREGYPRIRDRAAFEADLDGFLATKHPAGCSATARASSRRARRWPRAGSTAPSRRSAATTAPSPSALDVAPGRGVRAPQRRPRRPAPALRPRARVRLAHDRRRVRPGPLRRPRRPAPRPTCSRSTGRR